MRRILIILAGLILAGPAASLAQTSPPPPDPARFATEFAAFEAQDHAQPPGDCRIVFVGSSTIRFWASLDADMSGMRVMNRGFGGAQISDINAVFDRFVAPYHPRAIVFYAGENDYAAGRTAPDIVADFAHFMDLKTRALGATPVFFISLKPSRLREAQIPGQAWINARIRSMAAGRRDLVYIDVVPAMLGPDHRPLDIFRPDGLHMTPAGYAIWTPIVTRALHSRRLSTAACPD